MDLHLADRTFVVTAASAGLGRATASALVAEGARVVLVARRADVLAEVVAELGEDAAVALPADLSDPATPGRACELALSRFGSLDGALVSVGGPPRGAALANSEQEWRDAFDSVFLAALRVSRAVLEHATRDDVALAWVLSSTAREPLPEMAISNGLRPGLGLLVKQLADEVGPRGARVVGLMPGTVRTERITALHAHSDDPEQAMADAAATIPLRRLGEPEEFGRVAAFVLSPAASYLSGCLLPVDGGKMRTL
ncbi:SDR family NAD(P)-dependent oxidoreductase [Desertihabitans brevis]|uniref:SDR family NAD(P)-dependent oxidoreductase n=1 Tax=Desertihabitans brevis TaxID=2268447 RepID=A0A367YXT0_9ACTN|nr:SDR family oxidoreductase [Desertihabitans brevis]RCK70537.1 SDR family NAD(P)-dependent oxidoreductase [Desertihabitans brevis]